MSSKEKVVGVVDGRTFETDTQDVRLEGINIKGVWDLGYGREAIKLSDLIMWKEVTIEPVGKDEYGCTVAQVRLGDLSVNAEMQKATAEIARQYPLP